MLSQKGLRYDLKNNKKNSENDIFIKDLPGIFKKNLNSDRLEVI